MVYYLGHTTADSKAYTGRWNRYRINSQMQLAQGSACPITAIEIDAAAAGQATENVSHSPWADRVEIIYSDFEIISWKTDLTSSFQSSLFIDALKCPTNKGAQLLACAGNLIDDLLIFIVRHLCLKKQGVVLHHYSAEAEKRLWIQLGTISCFHCIVCTSSVARKTVTVLLNFGFEAKSVEKRNSVRLR